jgi:Flp pilus assembly protein TadD
MNTGNANDLERARLYWEESLSIREPVMEYHHNLGIVLERLGRVSEAIAHYRRALELVPSDPEPRLNLAQLLLVEGALDEAIEHFEKLVERFPENADPRFYLGIALLKKGQPTLAEKQFRRSLEIVPSRKGGDYFLGLSLLRQGKPAEAVGPLRKAASQDLMFRCALASALYQSGEKRAAQEEYDRVTLLDPEWRTTFAARAFRLATDSNLKQREPREALEIATQACQASEFRDPRLLDVLAVAQAANGDFKGAIKTATDALALAGEKPELKRSLEERLRQYEKRQPVVSP